MPVLLVDKGRQGLAYGYELITHSAQTNLLNGLLLTDHLLAVPSQLAVSAGVAGGCTDPVRGHLVILIGKQSVLVALSPVQSGS